LLLTLSGGNAALGLQLFGATDVLEDTDILTDAILVNFDLFRADVGHGVPVLVPDDEVKDNLAGGGPDDRAVWLLRSAGLRKERKSRDETQTRRNQEISSHRNTSACRSRPQKPG
jgi:hypothetical protein